MRQSSATSNTLWACVIFWGQITVQRYFVFVSTVGLLTLYIQELPYMNTFCECILKKSGPTYAHFQYNERKLMSFRFTMRYSSRKLSHEKVITTAATFEEKLLVLSWLRVATFYYQAKKKLKSPHFFKPGQGIWAKRFTHAHYFFPP